MAFKRVCALFILAHSNIFRKADFFETRDGVCRLMPPLTEQLSATAEHWRRLIGPVAEQVAKRLLEKPKNTASGDSQSRPFPTPLTQANRSRGRSDQRKKSKPTRRRPLALLDRICVECGVAVGANTKHCAVCRKTAKAPRKARRAGAYDGGAKKEMS